MPFKRYDSVKVRGDGFFSPVIESASFIGETVYSELFYPPGQDEFHYADGAIDSLGIMHSVWGLLEWGGPGRAIFLDGARDEDDFTGLSDGTPATITSGSRWDTDIAVSPGSWLTDGITAYFDYAYSVDDFTGMADGALTNVTSGERHDVDVFTSTTWLTDGTAFVPP